MNNRLKGNLLVLGQFVLLGLLIFYPRSEISYGTFSYLVSSLIIGGMFFGFVILAISGLALGKALTAHPIPSQKGELVTSGLYRFVRHPIYTALLLIGFSLVLSGGIFPHIIFYLLLVALLYYKAVFEEGLLAKRYSGYLEYSRKTGRFLPRLKR